MGRLIIPVCSKLPLGTRKQVFIGCGMYSNCSLCVPFPFLACSFLLTPVAVLASAFVWLTANLFGKLSSHTGRAEAQDSAGVAFINVCLMSGLVQICIFLGQSQSPRVWSFPSFCGPFMGPFPYTVSLVSMHTSAYSLVVALVSMQLLVVTCCKSDYRNIGDLKKHT